MKIADVKAYPTSFPIPQQNRVALGIGTAVKRDAVVVKVTTDEGITGWGEAHHGRAHTAVAKLIETTLRQLVVGMDALRDHGHLGEALPRAARQPRHGRRRLPRDQRHRHGPVGHPRQGAEGAAVSAARRKPQGDTCLRRWRLARLPAACRADRGGAQERLGRLQGDQVAPRRYPEERCRTTESGEKGVRRRPRHPHRRQHRLPAGGRAPGDAGPRRNPRRLAGGALPGPRLSQLSRGEAARPHAARRRRESLHPLRVQPRDRGRRDHHPAARPVEMRRHHRGAAHRRPRPRAGSCRSTRTAR